MAGEVEWRLVEDSSPENRELGEVVRRLEGIYSGDPSLDWTESRRRRAEALTVLLTASDKNLDLAERLEGAEYEIGGDEHLVVRVDEQADRVFKLTHGDCFGCYSFFSPHDPDLTGKHFHGSINEDPIFYLKRWMLLNFLGGYQTRFEGLLPPEEKLRMPRICVSQPTLDVISPTRKEIRESLAPYGFVNISDDAFLNFETRILLTDAAPRNVRIVDRTPALFDAIASFAPDKIYEWASLNTKPPHHC